MLIGLLESDQSGRRTLTYDSTTRSFVLEGAGDIQPAKLIDLANRQQILWTDRAVRDWALRTAVDLLKEANARSSRARTAAAAVSLASGDGLISSATPPPAATKVRHAWTWAIVAALCVTFVGLGTAYHADIRHQLAAAFSRQPTPYIELYFTNPQTLPVFLNVSRPDSFSFTIVNHEGRARTYSYVVTLSTSQGASTTGGGTIVVANGGASTRVVEVGPAKRGLAYTVTVTLPGRSETIHFTALARP